MGRKSSAAGGPVHSPIGCHYANEARNPTKQAKQKEQKKQNQKQTKQQPKRHTKNLHSDKGPYSTVPKDNDFALKNWIGMARKRNTKERNITNKIAIQEL